MSSPNLAYAPVGLLVTVFTLVIISPSNPQSYDPQTYLITSVLVLTAAMISFVMLQIILPTTDAHRRRWTLAAARRDMRDALHGRGRNRPEDETRLVDASRIGALVALKDIETSDVAKALRMADLARAARRVSHALDGLSGTDPDRSSLTLDRARAARAALAAADANGLRRAATWFADAAQDTDLALAADLAWAADLIDAPASPSPSGSVAASAAA